MAMSMSKGSEMTGLEYLWESRATFGEILFLFRECHDICVQSGLFNEELILQVDQCGVGFRQLSLDTATVAKRVSSQYLDTVIAFFTNIDDMDDPSDMFKLLGSQAKDLSICFRVIGAWARDLCGRFHAAQDGTVKEAEEFKRRFRDAKERAEKTATEIQANLDKAARLRKDAQETEDKWKISQIALSWNPIGAVVTSIGSSIAQSKTTKARELEDKAHEELSKAKTELERASDQHAKAEVCFRV